MPVDRSKSDASRRGAFAPRGSIGNPDLYDDGSDGSDDDDQFVAGPACWVSTRPLVEDGRGRSQRDVRVYARSPTVINHLQTVVVQCMSCHQNLAARESYCCHPRRLSTSARWPALARTARYSSFHRNSRDPANLGFHPRTNFPWPRSDLFGFQQEDRGVLGGWDTYESDRFVS